MRPRVPPVAILAVAVLLVAAAAAAVASPPVTQGDPSSRSAGRLGSLALYTWLGRLGLPVARITGTFDVGGSDVVIVYDPLVPFTQAETHALLAGVRSGTDLILAVAPESLAAAAPVLHGLGVDVIRAASAGTAVPVQPFDVAGRVRRVPMGAGFAIASSPPVVPLLVAGRDVVLGALRLGRGRAYVLGNTEPLSNDGLRRADSAGLVLSLLERARGGRIAFDEVHHGETTASGGAAAIFAGPVGVAAVLLAALLLSALAIGGRRLGAPDDDAKGGPPSSAAYVTAVAGLMARSRDRGPVAGRYAEELKRRLAAWTGVDPWLDDNAFCAALRAAGHAQAAEAEALLERARTLVARGTDDAALLRLARDVDALERRWPGAAAVPAQ